MLWEHEPQAKTAPCSLVLTLPIQAKYIDEAVDDQKNKKQQHGLGP